MKIDNGTNRASFKSHINGKTRMATAHDTTDPIDLGNWQTMNNNKTLDHFKAQIFAGKRTRGEAETSFSGHGQQWQDYRTITLPGFDGRQTLNLDDFWLEVFNHQKNEITVKLIGLETIVKYANTQQIKEPFTLVATLTYTAEDS